MDNFGKNELHHAWTMSYPEDNSSSPELSRQIIKQIDESAEKFSCVKYKIIASEKTRDTIEFQSGIINYLEIENYISTLPTVYCNKFNQGQLKIISEKIMKLIDNINYYPHTNIQLLKNGIRSTILSYARNIESGPQGDNIKSVSNDFLSLMAHYCEEAARETKNVNIQEIFMFIDDQTNYLNEVIDRKKEATDHQISCAKDFKNIFKIIQSDLIEKIKLKQDSLKRVKQDCLE